MHQTFALWWLSLKMLFDFHIVSSLELFIKYINNPNPNIILTSNQYTIHMFLFSICLVHRVQSLYKLYVVIYALGQVQWSADYKQTWGQWIKKTYSRVEILTFDGILFTYFLSRPCYSLSERHWSLAQDW